MTPAGFEPTTTSFENNESTMQPNWPVWVSEWFSVPLQTKWLWVWVLLQSLKLQISRLFQAKIPLIFRQLIGCEFTLNRVRGMIRRNSYNWILWIISFTNPCYKVLVRPQQKYFNIRKTANIEIAHARGLTICHHTFCTMVLGKLFVGLQ